MKFNYYVQLQHFKLLQMFTLACFYLLFTQIYSFSYININLNISFYLKENSQYQTM